MLNKIPLIALILLSFSVIRCGNADNTRSGKEENKMGLQQTDYPVYFRAFTLNNAEVTALKNQHYDQVIFQIINYSHGTKHPENRHEYGLIAYVNENGRMTPDENLLQYNKDSNVIPIPPIDLKTANYPYRLADFNLNTNIILIPQPGTANTTVNGVNIDLSNYVRFELCSCKYLKDTQNIKNKDAIPYINPSPPAPPPF